MQHQFSTYHNQVLDTINSVLDTMDVVKTLSIQYLSQSSTWHNQFSTYNYGHGKNTMGSVLGTINSVQPQYLTQSSEKWQKVQILDV